MRFFFNSAKAAPVLPRPPVHSDVPELHEAEIAAVYYSQRMAGDFYDFVRVNPHRVVFGFMDAAGRLEDTRAIVSAAQDTFRSLAPELLGAEEVNEAEAMVELCHELNRTILLAEGGVRACPAFAGCYDEILGTVCYFNAGHTPGLLRDRTSVTELGATSLPLGLFSHATCDAPMVALEPGAALLLVTRGIVESKCKGEEFGLDQVKKSLQRASSETAKKICETILDDVQKFMCQPPTHDDVTALALVRAAAVKTLAAGQG
jgi:serine phosphatase RsbU (regulator of sigma subunit)